MRITLLPLFVLVVWAHTARPVHPAQTSSTDVLTTGSLTGTSVSVETPEFEIVFTNRDGSSSVDMEIRDKTTGPVFGFEELYEHVQFGLWKVVLLEQPVPTEAPRFVVVDQESSMLPVEFTLTRTAAGAQELVIVWPVCAVDVDRPRSEFVSVHYRVRIEAGAREAEFGIDVIPALTNYAIYSVRNTFSIAVLDGTTDQALLPIGYLVEEPATTLQHQNLVQLPINGLPGLFAHEFGDKETVPVRLGFRPISQLSAYLRGVAEKQPRGLYIATHDPTGLVLKDYRYGASESGDAFRYQIAYGADRVTDPTQRFSSPVPVVVRPFIGDWWTAAEIHRRFLDGTSRVDDGIASEGPVADRADVAPVRKLLQQLLAFSPYDFPYVPPTSTGPQQTQPLSDIRHRIESYLAHHGLDRVSLLQFGRVWPEGNCLGVGEYELDQTWADNAEAMEGVVDAFLLYLYDNRFNADSPFFADEGWASEVVVGVDGEPHLTLDPCPVPTATVLHDGPRHTYVEMDTRSARFRSHMASVAGRLFARGVSGLFFDNFFWDPEGTSFVAPQPGFGPYPESYLATLRAMVDAASSPEFTLYSEVNYECYLRATGNMGPAQEMEDFLTGDSRVRVVPLGTVLYHHLALLGPVRSGYFYYENPSGTWLGSPSDVVRQRALRGSNWAFAYGWVNGSPLWCPDIALSSGVAGEDLLSFELPDQDALEEYKQGVDYAARLARLRAGPLYPFLNVGRRLRDLAFDGGAHDIEVILPGAFPDLLPVPEGQDVPAVAHAVWADATDPDRLAVAFTNHSGAPRVAPTFVLEPEAYGMDPSLAYEVQYVDETLGTRLVASFQGDRAVELALEPLVGQAGPATLAPGQTGGLLILPKP